MRIATRAAQLALAALLLWAAGWGLRLAWADYLFHAGTEEGRRRAAQLVPSHAEYQGAIGNWRRAVELNDHYSKGWIALALEAEAAGKMSEAERDLLKASSVDQQFEPRWALANFYFRRGNQEESWKWMRLAAERSYGDRTGLFRLSMRLSSDPSEIADRIFPDDARLRRDFVTFLSGAGDLTGAAGVARRLPRDREHEDLLLDLCDRLIHAGHAVQARQLWRGEAGLLVNGALAEAPRNKGFDWRLHWRAGVSTTWKPGGIRVELSGKQPDPVDLVSQYLWLEEAGAYRFTYRYRTDGLAKDSGVHWTAVNAEAADGKQYLSSGDWREERFEFRTAKPKQVVRLELLYARAPGTVRQEGIVFLEGGMKVERAAGILTERRRPLK